MENSLEKALSTDCGMFGLWDYNNYKDIISYDDWEEVFLEDQDIIQEIKTNRFVPIYLHSDGCFQFKVKINEPLTERESKYVLDKSENYLFSTDGTAYLSGIEFISDTVKENEGIKLDLEKGFYKVTVYLIEWDKEPGAKLDDGEISPDALPDFIIKLVKTDEINQEYRTKLDTFDKMYM